ncbi:MULTISPECIES: type II toxin-antitoxin system VapC family toxin [Thermococcus]|uniref:Ribonuclease VapC n=1 Tax=Thermococcus nautili TaxID=195522 RepID=W8NRI9_9EURY|nr:MULTISPECIES: type II toxin-antitoxin system VapC family toxin [Thermococcus]AHL21828.1 PilT domain-containing protein [Thermococcus nautili]NJE48931.1 type II toxin-antitoxin system VapC family toxin [Thermococcus sp. 9N3]
MKVVLDSHAILAYINDEPAAEKVQEYLNLGKEGKVGLYMNVVNVGEVYYVLSRRKGVDVANIAIALLKREPITFIIADERLALMAGRIKAFHKLSYADAFAAATAIDLDAVLLTGDDEFKSVEDKVKIEWL